MAPHRYHGAGGWRVRASRPVIPARPVSGVAIARIPFFNGAVVAAALLCAEIALWAISAPAAGAPIVHRPQYEIKALVAQNPPQVVGTLEVVFTNHSSRTLHDAVFFLFPNRFAAPDAGMNAFLRTLVYPEEDFDPGSIEVPEVFDRDRLARAVPLSYPVGVGIGLLYDFMGFFPAAAYIEVATRLDDPSQAGDVQFLFGTMQPF